VTTTTTLYNQPASASTNINPTALFASLAGPACVAATTTNPGTCDYTVVTGGTVDNFNVTLSSSPGSGNTGTFIVFKNGATTGISCTISGGATACNDGTNTATFAPGDKVAVRYQRTAGANFSRTMAFTLDNSSITTAASETLLVDPHTVVGSGASASATTITLTGSAIFTSATSYFCTVSGDNTAAATDDRWAVQYTSGSSFTIRSTAARPFRYVCVGN
jgi:hypothetical protein